MRRLQLVIALVVALAAAASSSADAKVSLEGVTARVSGLPLVQSVGQTYFMTITVRTRAKAVRPFCIDFDDDHNSWLFQLPAPHEYKKDVFCWKGLRPRYRASFLVGVVPARSGQHRLQIAVGRAEFFPSINTAVLNADSLVWSRNFVIG